MSFENVVSTYQETNPYLKTRTYLWRMKGIAWFFFVDFVVNNVLRRFYKFIEDAYSHANRTLLQLLLKDQQLIPRLRSLKRYFFLSQSSFLTHLLDLASTELRKSSKSASTARLQNLLDLALNTESVSEDPLFKEDIKITMADMGLYDFLLKVVTVSGAVKPEETGGMEDEPRKEKDDKKSMQGGAKTQYWRGSRV